MNETSPIAVLETRLPYLDRRALSQAWFDALHLARAREPAVAQQTRSATPLEAPDRYAHAKTCATESADRAPAHLRLIGRRDGCAVAEAQASVTRRVAPKTRLRTVERRIRESEPPRVANLTLAIDGARVQLSVRREGGRTRILAVCAAQHVDQVRRALAGLDLALRVRGETPVSVVRGRTPSC